MDFFMNYLNYFSFIFKATIKGLRADDSYYLTKIKCIIREFSL